MGLLKRLINRGLSGADSPPPPPDGRLPHEGLATGDRGHLPSNPAPTAGQWPPGPPPMPGGQGPSSPVADPGYAIESWRHPVSIDRKELWESGFDFAGPKISAAFEANGQSVLLSETDGLLEVNDIQITSDSDDFDYVEITHSGTGASFSIAEPTWALAVALHDAYLEPLDPDRSWQMGVIDETTVLFLARPGEIDAIARRSSLPIVADLAQLSPN